MKYDFVMRNLEQLMGYAVISVLPGVGAVIKWSNHMLLSEAVILQREFSKGENYTECKIAFVKKKCFFNI